MHKPIAVIAPVAAALVLAGCTSEPPAEDDHAVHVVASTSVYGSIASQIGGDHVEVTSIISSPSQDPHSYEVSARDRLAVQEAQLVIDNGGGYDAFMEELLADASDPEVITAVEFAPGVADGGEVNEHVWLNPSSMIDIVDAIEADLARLDPDGRDAFKANADELTAELADLETQLATLKTEAKGARVFVTEPLPGYIVDAVGLNDVTPEGFGEAVEEGTDVSPATLLSALSVIDEGDVRVVLTNAQTGGSETERVEKAAKDAGVPVVAFSELLPDGTSYSEWMSSAIQNLADALSS